MGALRCQSEFTYYVNVHYSIIVGKVMADLYAYSIHAALFRVRVCVCNLFLYSVQGPVLRSSGPHCCFASESRTIPNSSL